MKILSRILKSIWDGSLLIKVYNRLSHTKYVPSSEPVQDNYLARHFPGNQWKTLSSSAKKVWLELHPVFDRENIRHIAYAGAHKGEIALAIDEAFPGMDLYLLEPNPKIFKILLEKVGSRSNMKCLNIAAGAREEHRNMFVDNFSPASSLLPYEDIATKEFPFLGAQQTVKVQVKPLDRILLDCAAEKIDMLLMDVQGFENQVLEGANQTISSCKVIISELSLQALYAGSSTFESIYGALLEKGFHLRYLINPLRGYSQRIIQIDGIFIREQLGLLK